MTIHGFVLTIDGDGGIRRANATDQFNSVSIPFHFVNGVSADNNDMLGVYSRLANLLLHKRSLSQGEIAIYEGHRRIWREIVQCGYDVALVAEDDLHILDRSAFTRAIQDLIDAPGTWDIAKFFDYRPKRAVQKMVLGETNLLAYKYPASGAVAYLINARAAAALLKRRKIFRPVDEDFSHPWEFAIRVWSVSPNVVEEISNNLGGSIVESGREFARKHKNVFRSVYGNVLQLWKLVRSIAYRRSYKAASSLSLHS